MVEHMHGRGLGFNPQYRQLKKKTKKTEAAKGGMMSVSRGLFYRKPDQTGQNGHTFHGSLIVILLGGVRNITK